MEDRKDNLEKKEGMIKTAYDQWPLVSKTFTLVSSRKVGKHAEQGGDCVLVDRRRDLAGIFDGIRRPWQRALGRLV